MILSNLSILSLSTKYQFIIRSDKLLDEDVNFIVWLPDDDSASIQIKKSETYSKFRLFDIYTFDECNVQQIFRIENDEHSRCQNKIYRSTKTHYLYKSYDCARATGLAVTSSHMIKTCDMLRIKQSTNAKRRWNKLLSTSFCFCLADSTAQ